MKARSQFVRLVLLLGCVAGPVAPARSSNCNGTSVGFTPLNDLGTALYLGQFQGGLYPGGSNVVPAAHQNEGLARASAIQPLDTAGNPSPTGKYILLSIGMSNTTQEFCNQQGGQDCNSWSFVGQALADSQVNTTTLKIINGALGGQSAAYWDSPSDANYDRIRDQELAPLGLTEAQVQIAWVKVANPQPTVSLPAANADAYTLLTQMGNISRALKVRYPNIKIAFFSSRIYAGYASSTLNPEPYAYESGLAVKWLIEAQINQAAGGPMEPHAGNMDYNSVVPWIAWGPYLWADGLVPRSDGLIWLCADMDNDGTHPSTSGETKVGSMLLNFMLTSPFSAPWFVAGESPVPFADCNGDGSVTLADYATFAGCVSGPGIASGAGCGCARSDVDNDTDLVDAAAFQNVFTGPPPNLDPAFDDFERPTLGPNWQVLFGSLGIIAASDLGCTSGGVTLGVWQGSTFGANQFCQGEISAAWNPSNNFQLNVRQSVSTFAAYSFRRAGPTLYELRRMLSGSSSVLLTSGSGPALITGSIVRIKVQGSMIRGLIDGNVILTATDTNLTSGVTGVMLQAPSGTPASFLESWSGGSLP
ncbi:MAG TPA: hypothetical protein VGM03_23690 [Phycisphaerae bacterium]